MHDVHFPCHCDKKSRNIILWYSGTDNQYPRCHPPCRHLCLPLFLHLTRATYCPTSPKTSFLEILFEQSAPECSHRSLPSISTLSRWCRIPVKFQKQSLLQCLFIMELFYHFFFFNARLNFIFFVLFWVVTSKSSAIMDSEVLPYTSITRAK